MKNLFKTLLPFSPDYVFLSKIPIDYNPLAKNVVIHNKSDGTDWNVEDWLFELADEDVEMKDLLWKVSPHLLLF